MVTWTLCTLSACGLSLTTACNRAQRSWQNWVMQKKPCFEISSHWKESSIVVQWRKILFKSTFSRPKNPLSNYHICFITHNFVSWNNFGAVLVWVWKNVLYHSRKTLPGGKDGFVVEVQHILLTLSPNISVKKSTRPCKKRTIESNFKQIFLSNVC